MEDDIWTVQRILAWIEGYLAQHGDENPRISAQWLVSEALGVSRLQLFTDGQRPLAVDERAVLRDWTRRRGEHEPLQYITGKTAFRHITVAVRKGVLIPRPETEVLVSEALALLPAPPKPQDAFDAALLELAARLNADAREKAGGAGFAGMAAQREAASEPGTSLERNAANPSGASSERASSERASSERASSERASSERASSDVSAGDRAPSPCDELLVADLCTGSGCIACSIAYEHPRTRVFATDLSPAAVSLARENVAMLGLDARVDVIECDLGFGIPNERVGAFDLVISNPPYVPSSVMREIPVEVTSFEPALALDGGADGLDVFRRILDWCSTALKPGGAFAIELHETRLEPAAAQAREADFADVRIVNDLAGRPRVLTGRKPCRP